MFAKYKQWNLFIGWKILSSLKKVFTFKIIYISMMTN